MLGQIAAVTLMNLRSLPQRLGASSVVVIGMASVVAVVVAVLSVSTGFLETVSRSGSPERAIVLSSGANFTGDSNLTRENVATILGAPGIRRGADGKPLASADYYNAVPLTKKGDGLTGWVTVQGAGPEIFALTPEIRLVTGRPFKPGLHELIVGSLLQSQYPGLEIGDKVPLPSGDWTVVGVFESNGDSHESALLGDAETLMSAYRSNMFNDVTVRLDSAAAFDRFKAALTTNPTLQVDVMRENRYAAKQAKPLDDFLTMVACWVGGIMAIGAVFGALNTMYAAVGARSREIATLRAIGFGAGSVVVSVLAEALLLALLGAGAGAGLAWLFFNGEVTVSDGTVYAFAVTPGLLALGVGCGLAMGVIGGLFPAIRAARLPVAAALRAT